MTDSTTRFSSRVENYQRYRPGYPDALIPELLRMTGLGSGAKVADVGSGTGIFTRDLLDHELEVYAVEPNGPMREAAEASLGNRSGFHSINARAEQTGLAQNAVQLITAAQAFHWFDNAETRAEFQRILSPGGYLALIWNRRDTRQALQQEYEGLLREFAPDYGEVNHMNLGPEDIARFYGDARVETREFDYHQHLDFDGFLGRLKSSSYCPEEQSPAYIPLVTALLGLFDHYAHDGKIAFEYRTQLFLGRIES